MSPLPAAFPVSILTVLTLWAVCVMRSDGSRVLGVGAVPDERVIVWDAGTGTRLSGCEAPMPTPCLAASFNPLNRDQFVTSGMHGLYLWTVSMSLCALCRSACVLNECGCICNIFCILASVVSTCNCLLPRGVCVCVCNNTGMSSLCRPRESLTCTR